MKQLLNQLNKDFQQEWERSSFFGKVFFAMGLFYIFSGLLSLISPFKDK